MTFTKSSLLYAENQIILKKLRFERAKERDDVHQMNLACAIGAYWEREAERRGGNKVNQKNRNDFTALN